MNLSIIHYAYTAGHFCEVSSSIVVIEQTEEHGELMTYSM
jgi:hypothetical protein